MNQEIKNEMNVYNLNEEMASNTALHAGKIDENKSMEDMTEEEMIALLGNVPAFLDDDDGKNYGIPPFISTTNIIELFGWEPGESLDEAIKRKNREGK